MNREEFNQWLLDNRMQAFFHYDSQSWSVSRTVQIAGETIIPTADQMYQLLSKYFVLTPPRPLPRPTTPWEAYTKGMQDAGKPPIKRIPDIYDAG